MDGFVGQEKKRRAGFVGTGLIVQGLGKGETRSKQVDSRRLRVDEEASRAMVDELLDSVSDGN